jgi:large subunit ribosomal protein L5
MQTLNYYYKHIIRQDLLTKFCYTNCLEIPKLERMVLRFYLSQPSLKNLLPCLTALLLISSQKPLVKVTKKIKVTLRLKGGSAISCKVDLRSREKYFFLEKFIFLILPRLKNFRFGIQQNSVNFKIDNLFLFKELEKEYDYFQYLPPLSGTFFFKCQKTEEIKSFLSILKFPF